MIKRKAYYKVIDVLEKKRIPILIGLRRTDKSTILSQIKEKYSKSEIINCDDILFRSLSSLQFMDHIDLLINNGAKYIFLDEI